MASRLIPLAVLLAASGCASFESQECGGLYVHTYYGGLAGGYRFVVVNDEPSLRFASVDAAERYLRDDAPKVSFENENPLAFSCGSPVVISSDSAPIMNTIPERVTVEVVEPVRLNLSPEAADIVIR